MSTYNRNCTSNHSPALHEILHGGPHKLIALVSSYPATNWAAHPNMKELLNCLTTGFKASFWVWPLVLLAGHYPTPADKGMSKGVVRENTPLLLVSWKSSTIHSTPMSPRGMGSPRPWTYPVLLAQSSPPKVAIFQNIVGEHPRHIIAHLHTQSYTSTWSIQSFACQIFHFKPLKRHFNIWTALNIAMAQNMSSSTEEWHTKSDKVCPLDLWFLAIAKYIRIPGLVQVVATPQNRYRTH